MAGVDANTMGRARLDFADEHDIDEFVDVLGKYERGEISPEDWRRFRLVRGTYGQRQDNVQMLRIKIPQGIVTSSQMRALAGVAARYSRGFCHVTTRQNIQYHFVQLSVVEEVMRELADEGLTTREACGNSVRNITGCPYAGTSETEIFDVDAVRRSADALLPASSAGGEAAAQVQDRVRGLPRGSRVRVDQRHRLARAHPGRHSAASASPSPAARRSCRCPATCSTTSCRSRRCSTWPRRWCACSIASATTSIAQRNRLKFTIKALGWDGFRARFDEALAEFTREGGASLPFDADSIPHSEQAPDWMPAEPPTLQAVAAAASTPVNGPGILPGTVQAAAAARHLRALDAQQRQPAEAGRLLPRDRRGCRSATSPPVRCACSPISPRPTVTARCGSPSIRTCCIAG